MVKYQSRTIGGIAILLMLGFSPLSVTYSFGETDRFQANNESENSQSQQKERLLRAILTEKVVNGKLEVRQYSLPENISEKDMQRMLSFDGETSGWAYVNYKAYQSGIVLFDGKASKIGDNLWKISSNGTLNLEERQFDLKLSGKSNGSHVKLHGIASEGNLNYKIIFSGKFVETEDQNIYAISIVNSGLKNVETGQTIKLDHIGELTINSEKSNSIQEFRKSISVR